MKPKARDWVVPALLALFSVVPILGGLARVSSLSSPVTPENARFVAAPAPIVVHIVAATIYALLGAFQFSAGLRQRFRHWHRRAGMVAVVAGIFAGVSGIWMTLAYGIPVSLQGELLRAARVLVGAGMLAALGHAMWSIRNSDVPAHEASMIRAYALALGASTQVFVLGPWILMGGEGTGPLRDVLMITAWLINITVAEAVLRRRTARPAQSLSRVSPSLG